MTRETFDGKLKRLLGKWAEQSTGIRSGEVLDLTTDGKRRSYIAYLERDADRYFRKRGVKDIGLDVELHDDTEVHDEAMGGVVRRDFICFTVAASGYYGVGQAQVTVGGWKNGSGIDLDGDGI